MEIYDGREAAGKIIIRKYGTAERVAGKILIMEIYDGQEAAGKILNGNI